MGKVLICSFKDTLQSIIKLRYLKLETISKGTLVPEDLDFYMPLNFQFSEAKAKGTFVVSLFFRESGVCLFAPVRAAQSKNRLVTWTESGFDKCTHCPVSCLAGVWDPVCVIRKTRLPSGAGFVVLKVAFL